MLRFARSRTQYENNIRFCSRGIVAWLLPLLFLGSLPSQDSSVGIICLGLEFVIPSCQLVFRINSWVRWVGCFG